METIISLHVYSTGRSWGLGVILPSLWNFLVSLELSLPFSTWLLLTLLVLAEMLPPHEVPPDPLNQLAPAVCSVPGTELVLKDKCLGPTHSLPGMVVIAFLSSLITQIPSEHLSSYPQGLHIWKDFCLPNKLHLLQSSSFDHFLLLKDTCSYW